MNTCTVVKTTMVYLIAAVVMMGSCFAQLLNSKNTTASDALVNILNNKNKVPLALFPPGYIDKLIAYGDAPLFETTAEFSTSETEEGNQMMSLFDATITPSRSPQITGTDTRFGNTAASVSASVGVQVVSLYKQLHGDNFDSGFYSGNYTTTFSNTATDPSNATITYSGGPVISSDVIYLLVRDGNNVPAFYLFPIEGWNGTDALNLSGFWPQAGAISRVEIFAVPGLGEGWSGAITNTPPAVTYGPPIVREPGKTNLIFVTHGAIPPGVDEEESTAWVDDMTNLYTQYFTVNNMTDWQVVGYKWEEKAKYDWLTLDFSTFGPGSSLSKAWDEGEMLGSYISTQGWSHVHLIAHSAGAGLIQGITKAVKSNPTNSTAIHSTFLDPFLGFGREGKSKYGNGANWSEHYFVSDRETDKGPLWFTSGFLNNTYNVNVTQLDTNKIELNGYVSSVSGSLEPCTRTKATHSWPITFYFYSFFPDDHTNYNGFGFPLSKEGGGWEYALATYVPGNSPAHELGSPDPDCSLPPIDAPAYINPIINFTQNPKVKSTTGTALESLEGVTIASGSPVWIATFITPTNDINFVSFGAQFLSASGSQGLLTVYWDTNVIATIDERVARSEMRQYSFPIPRTQGSLTHMLGFRVDPFTTTQSSVLVTNVTTGLFGPVQPFSFTQTTNTSNGLKVWQLTGQAGFEYAVEASTNLVNWQRIAMLLNTNGTVRFVDPGSTNSAHRFYRALVVE